MAAKSSNLYPANGEHIVFEARISSKSALKQRGLTELQIGIGGKKFSDRPVVLHGVLID
jgi:hypothetical protein